MMNDGWIGPDMRRETGKVPHSTRPPRRPGPQVNTPKNLPFSSLLNQKFHSP